MNPVRPSTPVNIPGSPTPSPPASPPPSPANDALELTYITDKMLYDKKAKRLWIRHGLVPVCKAFGRHIVSEIFEQMLEKKIIK